jgi:uncharacterized protein YraI
VPVLHIAKTTKRKNFMTHYLRGLAVAFLSSAAFSTATSAQDAVVTADLHMRAGPSTQFPVVTTIAEDAEVHVYGCIGDYNWCDVAWRGNRGWVFGDYLNYYYENRYVPIVEYGPRIEVPIITFTFGSYWEDYYRDRPWYDRRDRWRAVWRGDRDRDDERDRRRGDRGRGDWRDADERQGARGDDARDEDRADRQDGDDDDRDERRRREARGDNRNADEGPEDTLEQGSVDDSEDDDQAERRRRQVRGDDGDDGQQQVGRGGPDQDGNQGPERRESQARGQEGNDEGQERRERQARDGGGEEPQARGQDGGGDDAEELLRRRRNAQ